MRFGEIIKFDDSGYAKKLHKESYSQETIRANIYKKRAQLVGAACGLGSATVFLLPSHGVSVIPGAYCSRNLYVQWKKLELLEREWVNRGNEKLPRRAQDTAIPVVIAASTMAIGLGITAGLESAGVDAITHAGTQAASHLAHHAQVLAANAHSASTAFGSGVHEGIKQMFQVFGGHPLHLQVAASVTAHASGALTIPLARDAYTMGFVAGTETSRVVTGYTAGKAIDSTTMKFAYPSRGTIYRCPRA